MTEIDIIKSGGRIVAYRVDGHSGYGTEGNDILCSAVSFMAQTVLLSLNEVCDIDEEDIHYKIEDGYLEVSLPSDLSEDQKKSADIVLGTMVVGFKSLLEEYSEFITLNIEEVDL